MGVLPYHFLLLQIGVALSYGCLHLIALFRQALALLFQLFHFQALGGQALFKALFVRLQPPMFTANFLPVGRQFLLQSGNVLELRRLLRRQLVPAVADLFRLLQ